MIVHAEILSAVLTNEEGVCYTNRQREKAMTGRSIRKKAYRERPAGERRMHR